MSAKSTKKTKTVASAEDKRKALDLALSQIEKNFGEGSIMTLGKNVKQNVESISTGAISLNVALGIGGIPRGRVVEIFGPESSGKTTLCLSIIAQSQKKGGVAAFIDAEHAFDPTYAKSVGVNLDDLLVSQPDTGEQALDIAEMLIKSNAVDLIVVDSVAALVPRAEIDGEMGQSHVGLQARLMSHALRKLTGSISKSKTCMIFINQIREKVGVMFGSPETTPGGRALKFYSSVRIDIRRIANLKKGEDTVGTRVRAKIVKNKVAAPFRQAEFDLLFTEGVSHIGSILDMADLKQITRQSGSWIVYGDSKLGQGRENARLYLRENPKILKEIETKIYQTIEGEATK
ncbi:MAG: recombinase RecA [Candidatus Omnitrophica bacterium]|nr:recombinase RecA [Candidatus Omnitrophota bacterium]